MAGSFQRMIKKLQNFVFGEETDIWEEQSDTSAKSSAASKTKKPETGPRMYAEHEPSKARIVHHYPKQGAFRFPMDVDKKREARPSQNNEKPRQEAEQQWSSWDEVSATTAKTPVQPVNERKRDTSVQETKQQGTDDQRSKESASSHEKELSKKTYFQGNDFTPADIPSPVFGFEKVKLHPDSLRKNNETIEPVEEQELPREKVEQTDSAEGMVEAEEAESGLNANVWDTAFANQEDQKVVELYTADKEETFIDSYEEENEENIDEEEEYNDFYLADEQIQDEESQTSEEVSESTAIKAYSPAEELVAYNGSDADDSAFHADDASLEAEFEDQTTETVHHEVETKEIETFAGEKQPDNKHEKTSQKHSNAQNETKRTGSPSTIPYNVLMYSSDKKKEKKQTEKRAAYQFPGLQLLDVPPRQQDDSEETLQAQKEQLESTLENFNVNAKVVDVSKGPSVTRFEVQPAPGVKVNKITNLTDDIKLALAAKDLRMEAPIPGKNAIGIEVPNVKSTPVMLREVLRRDVFLRSESPLTVAMGLDISGNPIVSDLQKMPHGLIAGATGSGKSVCINSILLSLLYKASPEEVKLLLIDPKMVELASYKGVPHLAAPVINDAKEATAGLKWAVSEMESRYEKLAHEGVRDIKKYNEKMIKGGRTELKMPYIVIVIDELADLMMVAPQDVEDAVCRIAQKARACGIHLLLATQRPSVDVITGLIKANIPSRTAFAVSSQADSRTILDMGGAERLIGKGDMLFHENGKPKPVRVQGTFVTDEEIDKVTDFVKEQKHPDYLFKRDELKKQVDMNETGDELFPEACKFIAEQGSASSSSLQRRFSIGYNRAAKLIDMMEERGIISESMGSKPRRVLMTYHEIQDNILAE